MKTRIAFITILAALALNTASGRFVTLVINTDSTNGEPLTLTNSISIKFNEAARISSAAPTPALGGGVSGTDYYIPLCLFFINGITVEREGSATDVNGMMVAGPATISLVPNPRYQGWLSGKALLTIEITPNPSRPTRD